MRNARKALAVFLPLLMLIGVIAGAGITANAEDGGRYIDASLTVGDNIVTNYYVDYAEYVSEGADTLYCSYNEASEVEEYDKREVTVDLKNIGEDVAVSDGKIVISVPQAAAQLAEPTSIKLYNKSSGNVVDEFSYSAKAYCDNVINMETSALLNYTSKATKLKNMCKAVVAYAKLTQPIFSDYMSLEGAVAISDDYSEELDIADASFDSDYDKARDNIAGSNISFRTAAFMCTSKAKMRFYFNVADENDSANYGDPVVTGPSTSWEKGYTEENGVKSYFIQVNDLKPIDFGEKIQVEYAGASIKMSVLDYAARIISLSSDSNLKNLAKSLIVYSSKADDYFNSESHTMAYYPAKAANCTDTGNTAYYYCTDCGRYFTDAEGENETSLAAVTVPANGHTPKAAANENVVDATCTAAGSYDEVVRCSVCNEIISSTPHTVDALGHDLGDYAQTKAPTCTEKGQERAECSRCDYYTTREIPANGHTPKAAANENVVDATCTAEGSYDEVVRCSVCNEIISSTPHTVDALGHDLGDYAQTKAPTCTEKGQERAECSRCDYFATREIPANGHTPKAAANENVVDATCTVAGSYDEVVRCSVCNAVISSTHKTTDALGHSEGSSWSVKTGATLTTSGTEVKTCTRCGAETSTRTVSNFTIKLPNTADYLYRVGNSNTVTLGTLFDNASGADITSVTATVTKNQGTATGTFTANASDWRSSTIKFNNTGIVTVTLKHGTATAATLKLEVVAGTNKTGGKLGNVSNAVLLGDVVTGGAVNSSTGEELVYSTVSGTLYGNGFTIDGVSSTLNDSNNTKLGFLGAALNLNGGTLNNVKVIGPNFKNAAIYQSNVNNAFTVKTSGTSAIYNSYIFGSRSAIGMYGTAVTIENSVIDGGRYSNVYLKTGSLNLHNVTTISQPRETLNGDTRCGYGIVISDEAAEDAKITATGYLKQYNWVGRTTNEPHFKGDNSDGTDADTAVSTLFTNMFSKASALTVTYNGQKYINTGILSLGSKAPRATGEALSSYSAASVTLSNVTGWAMAPTTLDAENDFVYYDETEYSPNSQTPTVPTFTWSYPSTYSSTEKQVNLSYAQGSSVTFNPKILTSSKWGNSLTVNVSMNGTNYNGDITFNAAGTYTIEYTITDPYNYAADGTTASNYTYKKYLTVSVTETVATISAPEFTFYDTSGTSLGSKSVDIGGTHYVMPNVSATDTVQSTTVSGTTVYAPVVNCAFRDNSSDFNYISPIFTGVNIKNYTDSSGTSTTYSKSSNLSALPSDDNGKLEWNTTWTYNGKSMNGSYEKHSTYGLCAYSIAQGKDLDATTKLIQFKFTAGNGEIYYYYIYYSAAQHNKPTGCVAEGSLVTMADGTKKAVEDVKVGDMLLTWNHFDGGYEAQPCVANMYHGTQDWDVVTLKFSDGTEVRSIYEHGFFDMDINEYAYIRKENVAQFVGHTFVKYDGNGGSEEVVLADYEITTEEVGSYTLQTAYNINFIVEDMLSHTAEDFCPGFFNYFEMGEGMVYDKAKMEADIETYGLYSYEDMADFLTYEQFEVFNGKYYKVLVGKGVLTLDDVKHMVQLYL